MIRTELIRMHIGLIRYALNDLCGVYSYGDSSAFTSIYGLNLERRIFDTILYEVASSDTHF
jgi:hypothetical protein